MPIPESTLAKWSHHQAGTAFKQARVLALRLRAELTSLHSLRPPRRLLLGHPTEDRHRQFAQHRLRHRLEPRLLERHDPDTACRQGFEGRERRRHTFAAEPVERPYVHGVELAALGAPVHVAEPALLIRERRLRRTSF